MTDREEEKRRCLRSIEKKMYVIEDTLLDTAKRIDRAMDEAIDLLEEYNVPEHRSYFLEILDDARKELRHIQNKAFHGAVAEVHRGFSQLGPFDNEVEEIRHLLKATET